MFANDWIEVMNFKLNHARFYLILLKMKVLVVFFMHLFCNSSAYSSFTSLLKGNEEKKSILKLLGMLRERGTESKGEFGKM